MGHGAFGTVWAAVNHKTKEPHAIKVMDQQHICEMTGHTPQLNDHAFELPEHPFVVKFEGFFESDQALCLVLQWVPGGDLHSLLRRVPNSRCSSKAVRFYATELVLALEHIHAHGMVYHDLRPENVLLDAEGHIMLSDVAQHKGNVHAFDGNSITLCGTLDYIAPEILAKSKMHHLLESRHTDGGGGKWGWIDGERSDGVTRAWPVIDWWSLGILLFELLAGQFVTPFHVADDPRTTIHRILHDEAVPFPAFFSIYAMHLIQRLLTKESMKRMGYKGVDEVKRDVYFGGVDWEAALARKMPAPYPCQPTFEIEKVSKVRETIAENHETSQVQKDDTAIATMDLLETLQAHEHAFRRAKWMLRLKGKHAHDQLNSEKGIDQMVHGQCSAWISTLNGDDPLAKELEGSKSVITAQVKRGWLAKYKETYNNDVRPKIRDQPGYRASRLLVDSKASMAISIITWRDEAAMHNSEKNGALDNIVKLLSPMVVSLARRACGKVELFDSS